MRAPIRRICSVACAIGLVAAISQTPAEATSSQRALNALAARLNRGQSALAGTESELASIRKSIDRASIGLALARSGLSTLSRGLYMGGMSESEALFEAKSVTDLADRISFVDHMQSFDKDVLRRVAIARVRLRREQAALGRLERSQRAILARLRRERSKLEAMFRAEHVLIGRRAAPRVAPTGRGVLKVCPVDRPRAYSDDFGAPRHQGSHQGNDILAPRATPIRAPFDGRILHRHSGMGGNEVYVYGAAGHVFNAHLSGYSDASGTVPAGTVIGYVGNTGDAAGGPTHDHFEWHPGNGPAIDPYRLLNEVC